MSDLSKFTLCCFLFFVLLPQTWNFVFSQFRIFGGIQTPMDSVKSNGHGESPWPEEAPWRWGFPWPGGIYGTTEEILLHQSEKVLETAPELLPHHSRNVSVPSKKSFGAFRGSFCRLLGAHLGSSWRCFPITWGLFWHVFGGNFFVCF